MSNDAITWAFRQDLPSGPKFVLVVLADKADSEHSCFPGQDLIARRTGMGVRTVRTHLAYLEDHRLIERRSRFRTDGTRTSDRYVLPVEGLPAEAPLPSDQPAADSAAGQAAKNDRDQRPIRPGNPKKNPQEELFAGSAPQTPLTLVNEGQPKPPRKRRADPLFDVILEVCEIDAASLTGTARGMIGKTRRELAEVGATPESVRERADEYHARFRGASLTPTALLKHWPSLTPPPPVRESWLR